MRALVVDGANVMGSRPDGWWRDRAGAARRLLEQLSQSKLEYDAVVLVVEGAARKVDNSGDGRVQVVRAAGSGDDAVVAEVEARVADQTQVTVVTADRGLAARVGAAGAGVLGPSWLLRQLS